MQSGVMINWFFLIIITIIIYFFTEFTIFQPHIINSPLGKACETQLAAKTHAYNFSLLYRIQVFLAIINYS